MVRLSGTIKPQIPPGATYIGDYDAKGQFHGVGKYTSADGRLYEGEFKSGKASGKGSLTFPDHDIRRRKVIVGEFYDAQRVRGKLTYVNGAEYEGELHKALEEGKGEMRYSNGDVYVGEWLAGDRSGFGEFTDFRTGEKYIGNWKDDKFDGEGQIIYKDDFMGRISFKGQFVKGLKFGFGVVEFVNGSHYSGNWKDDKYDGEGELKSENGNVFVGTFVAGKKKKGVLTYAKGGVYIGEFSDERRHGKGRFEFPDGSLYDGDWVKGSQHGFGHLIYVNGEEFKGAFANGKWGEGEGWFRYLDGSKFEGQWKGGKRHGVGKYTLANGNSYEGGWQDDLQHGMGKMTYVFDKDGKKLDPPETYELEYEKGLPKKEGNYRVAALRMGALRVRLAEVQAKEEMKILSQGGSKKDVCLVCRENKINTIFLECAHCAACSECAFDQKSCPKCKAKVARVVRTFMT